MLHRMYSELQNFQFFDYAGERGHSAGGDGGIVSVFLHLFSPLLHNIKNSMLAQLWGS